MVRIIFIVADLIVGVVTLVTGGALTFKAYMHNNTGMALLFVAVAWAGLIAIQSAFRDAREWGE